MKDLTIKSYIVVLHYMPSQIRRLTLELMSASLFIEFLSIAAILLYENEIQAKGARILQLTQFSKEITAKYIASTDVLLKMAEIENFSSEREEWAHFGLLNMSSAYSDDEPDISKLTLREPNPDYNPE